MSDLVTLRFMAALTAQLVFEPFDRHWHHVPRVGDMVEIDMEGDGKMMIHGEVLNVVWTEQHVVVELV